MPRSPDQNEGVVGFDEMVRRLSESDVVEVSGPVVSEFGQFGGLKVIKMLFHVELVDPQAAPETLPKPTE